MLIIVKIAFHKFLQQTPTANFHGKFPRQIPVANSRGKFPRQILEYVMQKMVWNNPLCGRVSHVMIKDLKT